MQHAVAPELEDLLDNTPVPHFSSTGSGDSPHMILHTSGSTGLPKPAWYSPTKSAVNDMHFNGVPGTDASLESIGQRRLSWGHKMEGRTLILFVPFHVISSSFVLDATVYYGKGVYVSCSERQLLNADTALDAIEKLDIRHCFVSPSMLEPWPKDESVLKTLEKLDSIVYGGAK
jgi:acyl-CoA synthetase (AMP-forming)/AMP-acid ligase II